MHGTIDVKRCSKCHENKPVSEFCRLKRSRVGLQPQCKACQREHTKRWRRENKVKHRAQDKRWKLLNADKVREHSRKWHFNNLDKVRAGVLRRQYGITFADYERMMEAQGFMCVGCKTSIREATPHVDHCHKTKKVRGLLCQHCNRSLGLAFDNAETLRRLADYLESHDPDTATGRANAP